MSTLRWYKTDAHLGRPTYHVSAAGGYFHWTIKSSPENVVPRVYTLTCYDSSSERRVSKQYPRLSEAKQEANRQHDEMLAHNQSPARQRGVHWVPNPRYHTGVYAETVKLPKRSGRAPLRDATAPRIRASLGAAGHEAAIEKAIVHANAAARAYNRALVVAYKKYGEEGPTIALIGQDHFPASVKNHLERAYVAFQRAQDAVALHYAALGKRTPLWKSEYPAKMVKAGYYGTGTLQANPKKKRAKSHKRARASSRTKRSR